MKDNPRKVFIKENGKYKEITYEEYCMLKERDESYAVKQFILIQGYLLEVDDCDKKAFLKEQRRYNYINSKQVALGVLSLDALDNDNGELSAATSQTASSSVEDGVIQTIMAEDLRTVITSLGESEKHLLELIYFKNLSQHEAAKILGISQPAVKKRLDNLYVIIRHLLGL